MSRRATGLPSSSLSTSSIKDPDLVVVIPISKVGKGVPTYVEINPPEGGVSMRSFIKCEAIHSIDKIRLVRLMGKVSEPTMVEVEDRIKILLDLYP